MPLVTAQELIDAGVHYGHQASRWNPKMKPFIHGKRHKIHVINLEETIRGLYQATHFVRSLAATGAQIMFLGTKKQIRPVVEAEVRVLEDAARLDAARRRRGGRTWAIAGAAAAVGLVLGGIVTAGVLKPPSSGRDCGRCGGAWVLGQGR